MHKTSAREYSVKKISKKLMLEITDSLRKIKGYGSVEIYVQGGVVTQITTRNIKKTQMDDSQE